MRYLFVSLAVALVGAAAAQAGPSVGISVFGGSLAGEGGSTRVPQCIERGGLLEPPRPPRGGDDGPQPAVLGRDHIRCMTRFFGSIERIAGSFVVSVQRGNEIRACKLLASRERERLGGAGCPASLAGLGNRLRVEREPRIVGFSFRAAKPLRGEFDLSLVHPFERIGIRFEAEDGFWRVCNIRDLLRQQPPAPARG
jgi:hypothetical protein